MADSVQCTRWPILRKILGAQNRRILTSLGVGEVLVSQWSNPVFDVAKCEEMKPSGANVQNQQGVYELI